MTQTILNPTRTPVLHNEPMVHLASACCGDEHVAACGAPIKGVDATYEELDCVVCAELGEYVRWCPLCGERMW